MWSLRAQFGAKSELSVKPKELHFLVPEDTCLIILKKIYFHELILISLFIRSRAHKMGRVRSTSV